MKLGYRTQLFQPLKAPIENVVSFYSYILRHHFNLANAVSTAVLICSVIGGVMDFFSFFGDSGPNQIFYLVGIALSLAAKLVSYTKHYDERFTTISDMEDAYADVQPPDAGWERTDLILTGSGTEPVFVSAAIDDWLAGEQPIGLWRDRDYERSLHKMISNNEQWGSVYWPFLRSNHRDAMYLGKQFYNEKKFGISSEVAAGTDRVHIHKTCYFDSYLTNVIPGKELISNRDNIPVATTYPELMPYQSDIHHEKHLLRLGEKRTANEPGVTTLCLLQSGFICLWQQNRMAQCSTGRITASGSGSADWDDCKGFLNDSNGFRKAVIRGMQRELWEESNGSRELHIQRFMQSADTRILGYFRWLKKAGKSEFVGITRLRDSALDMYLSPEKSEVTKGEMLPSATVRELIDSIGAEIAAEDDLRIRVGRCSVSCAMAMLALKKACEQYCVKTCDCYDHETTCCPCQTCKKKPFDVLFEGVAIVHPEG